MWRTGPGAGAERLLRRSGGLSVLLASASGHQRRAVITALGVAQILAWGSSYYLLAVLARPIVEDTGWPLAWVVGGLSLGLLASGLVSPAVGRAIEDHGGRPVLAASAILLAVGLVGLAAAPSIPFYFAAWLVLGLGMGAGLYDAAFATLGRLYGQDARGAITTLTLWGGFASTMGWPLSAYLLQALGWRGTCLIYAALLLAVVLPIYLLALPREERRDAAPVAIEAKGASEAEGQPPNRAFLVSLLAVIVTVGGVISAIISVHLLTVLQDRGVALATAVALGALVGPSQVGARVVEMLVGSRHHPIWTLAASVGLIASGVALLWLGVPVLAVPLVCYGAGNGIWSIARGTVPLTLFGASGYAALMGRLALPSLLAQAAAPLLGGILLDRFGASAVLAALSMCALLNVVLVALLWAGARPRRAPAPVA